MDNLNYKWSGQVRDYELDGNGGVNHATYIHYLEEARNEYARSVMGMNFSEFKKAGYEFVIAGLEITYRKPLFAQDKFYVTAKLESYDDKRFNFEQEIYLESGNQLAAKAIVRVACVDMKSGKACMPEMLAVLIKIVCEINECNITSVAHNIEK